MSCSKVFMSPHSPSPALTMSVHSKTPSSPRLSYLMNERCEEIVPRYFVKIMPSALAGLSSRVRKTHDPTKDCPRQNLPAPTQPRQALAGIDNPAQPLHRASDPLS